MGEVSYVLGNILCALGVCISAKSGLGVSTVVSPAFVISSYTQPLVPFLTFGTVDYIMQGIIILLLALTLRKFSISYPLAFFTAVFYGVSLDLWRLVFGTEITEVIYLKIIYMIAGALITEISIALLLRSYLPQQGYDFAVKQISVNKNLKINAVKWAFDIFSLALAVILMFILFGKFDFSLVGIGTLILAVVNAPMIALFGKILDKFMDFSPFFKTFAEKVFKVGITDDGEIEKDNETKTA